MVQSGFVPILKGSGLQPFEVMRVFLHIDIYCNMQK
jgi:hypothetical protein